MKVDTVSTICNSVFMTQNNYFRVHFGFGMADFGSA